MRRRCDVATASSPRPPVLRPPPSGIYDTPPYREAPVEISLLWPQFQTHFRTFRHFSVDNADFRGDTCDDGSSQYGRRVRQPSTARLRNGIDLFVLRKDAGET